MSRLLAGGFALLTIGLLSWCVIQLRQTELQSRQTEALLEEVLHLQKASVRSLKRLDQQAARPKCDELPATAATPAEDVRHVGARSDVGNQPSDEFAKAPSEEEPSSEHPSAAREYVDRAISTRRWSARDSEEMRRLLATSDGDERFELMRLLSVAINEDQLVSDVMPPF